MRILNNIIEGLTSKPLELSTNTFLTWENIPGSILQTVCFTNMSLIW